MSAVKESDLEVEIEDEDDFEIEIEDDTPEEDRGRARAPDEENDNDDPDDDELKQYSAGAAKRIKTLTRKRHEERRAKEDKERQLNEALGMVQKLRGQLNGAAKHIVTSSKEQLTNDLKTTKEALAAAVEVGDGAKVAELSDQVTDIRTKLNGTLHAEKEMEQRGNDATPDPNDQSTWPEARKRWAKNNSDWFHKDRRMTAFVYGVHQELILDKGIKPDTEEYFEAIDEAMREQFPKRFKAEEVDEYEDEAPAPRRATPRVANFDSGSKGSESKKGGKKVIRLTKSQVELCNRLGITPQQYIKEQNELGND